MGGVAPEGAQGRALEGCARREEGGDRPRGPGGWWGGRVKGSGSEFWGLGVGVWGQGFGVWGLGCRV